MKRFYKFLWLLLLKCIAPTIILCGFWFILSHPMFAFAFGCAVAIFGGVIYTIVSAWKESAK